MGFHSCWCSKSNDKWKYEHNKVFFSPSLNCSAPSHSSISGSRRYFVWKSEEKNIFFLFVLLLLLLFKMQQIRKLWNLLEGWEATTMAATAASNTNVDIPWRRHPQAKTKNWKDKNNDKHNDKTYVHTTFVEWENSSTKNRTIATNKPNRWNGCTPDGAFVRRIWQIIYLFICFATNRYWSICSTTLFGCCLSVCCWQLVGLRLAWLHQKHQFIRMNKLDMVIFFWFGQSARCRLL